MPFSPKSTACYRPRDPRGSPFYRLVEDHIEDFALSLRQRETRKPVPDPRYHGAFAPNAPLRPLVTAAAKRYARKTAPPGRIGGAVSRAWAALISRVFEVDPLICRRCGTRMEPIAVILEVSEVTRLMTHLGLSPEFPKTLPARSPPEAEETEFPDEDSQLDPRVDL